MTHITPGLLTRDICKQYIEEHLFDSTLTGNTDKLQNGVECIGLELEAFPYKISEQKEIKPARLYGGSESLAATLIRTSGQYGGKPRFFDQKAVDENQEPQLASILFPEGSNFNFEPGAQIEIATTPCISFQQLNEQINGMQQILARVSSNGPFQFLQTGTNPFFTVTESGMQMNSPRYLAMARYFNSIGPYGIMMMVQTCSLQVNMDIGMESAIQSKRIIAANLLAPFAIAVFANSSVTAGKANGHKSYRSYIWQQLDATRTGVLPFDNSAVDFDKEAIIDAYLNFALKAPVIFIEDFTEEWFPDNITMEYWMKHPVKGLLPSLAHFKNHLTLLFPEVRLKGYLELRSVDAPPREWQMVPALFYSGLLYNNNCLNKTLDILLPLELDTTRLMKQATQGLESDDLFKIAKKLLRLAVDGLAALPNKFKSDTDVQLLVSFYENYTMRRKTFADDFLEKLKAGKITIP